MNKESVFFNSKSLQKIVIEIEEESEKYKRSLDEISNDIRNLEEFIKYNSLGISFSYKLPEIIKDNDVIQRYLIWEGNRIKYKTCINNSLTGPKKALIETKIEIRIETYLYLSNFLEELFKAIKELER